MVVDMLFSGLGAVCNGIQFLAAMRGFSVNPFKKEANQPLLDPPPPPTPQAVAAQQQRAQAEVMAQEIKRKHAEKVVVQEQKQREQKQQKQKQQEQKQQEQKQQEQKQQEQKQQEQQEQLAAAARAAQETKKAIPVADKPTPLNTSILEKIPTPIPVEEKPPEINNTSTLHIAPKEPPPFSSERKGAMDIKILPIIEMLNHDGGSWKLENINNKQIVTNGVNSFGVEKDHLTTQDNDVETFKAMLKSFENRYPGEKIEIKAGNPELMKTWTTAVEQTGIKANIVLAETVKPAQQVTAEQEIASAPKPLRPK